MEERTMTEQIKLKKKYLTDAEHQLLKEIVNDKYAAGPFTGMIYNAYVQSEARSSVKSLTKKALACRLTIQELAQTGGIEDDQ